MVTATGQHDQTEDYERSFARTPPNGARCGSSGRRALRLVPVRHVSDPELSEVMFAEGMA